MLQVKIKGMSCEHCVANIKKNLMDAGAENVELSLTDAYANFEGPLSIEEAKTIIEDLGFEVL